MENNVSLRIVTLAHGNRSEDDLYLVISVDFTVNELKQRIQESLSQRPSPPTQRLIYQGRPLLDDSVALRHILRIDPRSSASSTSHVIHLVIRDLNASNTTNAPTTTSTTTGQAIGQSQHGQQQQILPSFQQTHLHHPPALAQTDQMRIHNQLHNLQHQLSHNQAHQRAMAQAMPGRQQNATPATATAQTTTPVQPGPMPNTPAHSHAQQNSPAIVRIEERIGPDGERIVERLVERRGPDGSAFITRIRESSRVSSTMNLDTPDPNARPSSAPGASPPADSDPVHRAANPPLPPHMHLHAPRPQVPMGFPFPPPMQIPMPVPLPGMMHPLPQIAPLIQPQSQPVAWLLSSPQGPQGIVFAPGQGFFSTIAPITNVTSQVQEQAPTNQPTSTTSSGLPHPPTGAPQPQAQLIIRPQDGHAGVRTNPAPPQPGAQPQPPAPGQQVAQAPAAAAARPGRPQIENNELVAFFIERAWLFVRLYVFVFIFSEFGTWRRLLMLTSAIVFCLLPRENPFNNLLQLARRHFDNLIGPPNIPERQAQADRQPQGQPQPGNNSQNAAQPETQAGNSRQNQPQRQMPTPEEAARRLLQQQHRRNPNPVIDMLHRLEQGVALFLASLVPGLGERHVQAREQARRILEEEERRAQEERERQQQGQQSGDQVSNSPSDRQPDEQEKQAGPLPDSWNSSRNTSNLEASSSGIDTGGSSDNALRARGSGA